MYNFTFREGSFEALIVCVRNNECLFCPHQFLASPSADSLLYICMRSNPARPKHTSSRVVSHNITAIQSICRSEVGDRCLIWRTKATSNMFHHHYPSFTLIIISTTTCSLLIMLPAHYGWELEIQTKVERRFAKISQSQRRPLLLTCP